MFKRHLPVRLRRVRGQGVRFIIFGALATVLPFQSAEASAWQLLSNSDGIETYIDTDSFTKFGNTVKAWIRRDYPAETAKKKVRVSKVLLRVDCRDKTYTMLAFTDYDKKGQVLSSGSVTPEFANHEPVVPDTTSHVAYERMCSDYSVPN
jgi:hypothetical protein